MGIPFEYSAVDMATVASNIDEFIIPENQKACLLLWSKNIFTIMCNNYDNNESWITIAGLDEHNQEIFNEMAKKDPRFGSTWGGKGFRVPVVPGKGKDAYSAFKPLIEMFSMQDVQKEGYLTQEEFLTYYTDCFKMVHNPDYVDMKEPKAEDYVDLKDYLRAYDEFCEKAFQPREIRVFDESKMTKTFDEYLNESEFKGLYDPDNNRLYYNKFYYDAHMRYKSLQETPKFS